MEEEATCSIGMEMPEMKIPGSKKYTLPPWRINEIILLAIETLSAYEYYKPDFDYKKMVRSHGIKVRGFSKFTKENLEGFRKRSISSWREGVCCVFWDPESKERKAIIAYDDKAPESEQMQIVFHEFGHVIMGHTEQSLNGELEANAFSLAMTLFIIAERATHADQRATEIEGTPFVAKGIKSVLQGKRR